MADFFRDVTQAERGLVGTIVQLTLRPARVIDTYLYTDRKRFLKPTRYLVFCFSLAALQVFVIQTWYGKPVQELVAEADATDHARLVEKGYIESEEIEVEESKAEAELHDRYHQFGARFSVFYNEFRTFFAMLFIPVLGLLYYFFYGRHGFNIAEAMVAATYLHAHLALLASLFLPLFFLGSDAEDYELWSSVENSFTGLYLLFGVTQVFTKRWWDTLIALLWLLLLLVVVAMCSPSFIFLGGATARVWMTDASYSSSPKFLGHLIQVLLLLPAALFLILRLHPQREKKSSHQNNILAYVLLTVLLVGMSILSFSLSHT